MDCREITYEIEEKYLSEFAFKSANTKGRVRPVPSCTLRTEFQRDRDRIIHSKAFRRLKHKTQVFLSPEGDHYRTRLTHTLEVSQIARTIARCLRMNEDLTEAISLGHDLGHTPFGHAGERVLKSCLEDCGGFKHSEQSLRVVDILENDGRGMNLTYEVRDGIVNHTRGGSPSTMEGKIVRISDQIAYLNHDLDDALRAGVVSTGDIPVQVTEVLGKTHGERINTLINDVVNESYGKNEIYQSQKVKDVMDIFRTFMEKNVYFAGAGKSEEPKAEKIIKALFDYYMEHPEDIPEYIRNLPGSAKQKTADYISMMSDGYAVKKFQELFVPKCWSLL